MDGICAILIAATINGGVVFAAIFLVDHLTKKRQKLDKKSRKAEEICIKLTEVANALQSMYNDFRDFRANPEIQHHHAVVNILIKSHFPQYEEQFDCLSGQLVQMEFAVRGLSPHKGKPSDPKNDFASLHGDWDKNYQILLKCIHDEI